MIILKSVFLIAIVAVAMIGVMVPSVFTLNEAHAEMIQGDNIRKNTPYGCLLSDVNTSNKQNQITVKFNAYTRSPDISVVIQMDGKTKFIQEIPKQIPTKISETFSISEQNSHNLGICLQKSWAGTDERMLDITNVKFTTTKITPPSTPTPSTPTPNIEKSIDCTLKQKPQFDRYYEYGSNWEISIVNPHPNNCKYEVQIYDSAKNYDGAFDSKLTSSLFLTFDQQSMSDGEYFIVVKSITDGKSYGYYPLTILDKTTPIDPTIILIVIVAVVAVVGIAVAVSKRKKGDSTTEPKPKKEPKKSSSTRQNPPTKTATSASSSPLDPEHNAPKTPSEALDELARKINPDYKTNPTSPPPVDPKYATESTKGPIQSEPKKSQKKASPTMPKQPKRTVNSTIDSELDRILNVTNPLEVLGLPTGTSFSVIKATYRELTIKYDPSKGIVNKSDIEKQRDQKVSTKLNHAYSQLKRQNRG